MILAVLAASMCSISNRAIAAGDQDTAAKGHKVAEALRSMDDSLWGDKYNFAIPDAPAFQLLSVDASTILRPQTTQALRLAFSKFEAGDGTVSLPRALAVEFSPLLLTTSGDARAAVLEHPRTASTRISLATARDGVTGATTRFAVGFRISIVDQRSFARTDQAFPESLRVTRTIEEIVHIRSVANERAIMEARKDAIARGKEFDPSTVPVLATQPRDAELVDFVKKRLEKRYWNATSFEGAIAFRGSSADSVGHGTKFDALSAWATYAYGVNTWGQWLLGARGGATRDSLSGDFSGDGSAAVRFYFGTARMKGFAEAQGTGHKGSLPKYLLNSGLEAALREWLWLDFSLGVDKSGSGRATTVSSFKLKASVPGTN